MLCFVVIHLGWCVLWLVGGYLLLLSGCRFLWELLDLILIVRFWWLIYGCHDIGVCGCIVYSGLFARLFAKLGFLLIV